MIIYNLFKNVKLISKIIYLWNIFDKNEHFTLRFFCRILCWRFILKLGTISTNNFIIHSCFLHFRTQLETNIFDLNPELRRRRRRLLWEVHLAKNHTISWIMKIFLALFTAEKAPKKIRCNVSGVAWRLRARMISW